MELQHSEVFRYRLVERRILELIEGGALSPGSRVPSLRQMSTTQNVGIASVNHSYLELERKGILEARPRSGFFVRQAAAGLELPAARQGRPSAPQISTRSGLIRTVLECVGDRDLLPFGVVCPEEALLPGKALARLTATVLRERPDLALNYAPVPGSVAMRREQAHRLSEQGLGCSPEDVLITNGCMEALSIALRCLTRPGDVDCIHSPPY